MCNGEIIHTVQELSIITSLIENNEDMTQTSSCSPSKDLEDDKKNNNNSQVYQVRDLPSTKTHINLLLISNSAAINGSSYVKDLSSLITAAISISWLIDTICEQNIPTNINKYIIQLK